LTEPIFQPLQFYADSALRRAELVRSAGKTPEVSNGHKRLHGVNIERRHGTYPTLSSLK
jgi:hypothetical protein